MTKQLGVLTRVLVIFGLILYLAPGLSAQTEPEAEPITQAEPDPINVGTMTLTDITGKMNCAAEYIGAELDQDNINYSTQSEGIIVSSSFVELASYVEDDFVCEEGKDVGIVYLKLPRDTSLEDGTSLNGYYIVNVRLDEDKAAGWATLYTLDRSFVSEYPIIIDARVYYPYFPWWPHWGPYLTLCWIYDLWNHWFGFCVDWHWFWWGFKFCIFYGY